MEKFKDELLKLFRVECADHSKKMNPAKMREHLVNTFPHKFSIPSEMEIKKFINSKSQKLKYKSRVNKNPNERKGRKLLESWLIIPLFPVGILLGWGEGQMLICCVNLFVYFRLYKVPDGKL